MTTSITRRGAILSSVAGATAVVVGSVAAAAPARPRAGDEHPLGSVRRGPGGQMRVSLRIIAADDFEPVGGVEVFLTFVGCGADGGGALETSDNEGIARFGVSPGPWQVNLTPPKGTRFCKTEFSKIENMLTVLPDGSCFPTQFRVAVIATEWREMRDHVHNAN